MLLSTTITNNTLPPAFFKVLICVNPQCSPPTCYFFLIHRTSSQSRYYYSKFTGKETQSVYLVHTADFSSFRYYLRRNLPLLKDTHFIAVASYCLIYCLPNFLYIASIYHMHQCLSHYHLYSKLLFSEIIF